MEAHEEGLGVYEVCVLAAKGDATRNKSRRLPAVQERGMREVWEGDEDMMHMSFSPLPGWLEIPVVRTISLIWEFARKILEVHPIPNI